MDDPKGNDRIGGVWMVLEHTAGPATPEGGVLSSPHFPLHVAFLRRLAAEGVLIAGGPLPDTPGSGMTVVRATTSAQATWVAEAARNEDGAVLAGLLQVRVRPWRVVLSGLSDSPEA